LVLFLMVAFGAFGASSTFGPRVETNVELSVITCAVWLFALVRILPLQATSRLRALTVALAMNVLQAVMFGLAGYNWDPYIDDVLQLVFGLPILAAGWWLVAGRCQGPGLGGPVPLTLRQVGERRPMRYLVPARATGYALPVKDQEYPHAASFPHGCAMDRRPWQSGVGAKHG
jgi:hypothetical protein